MIVSEGQDLFAASKEKASRKRHCLLNRHQETERTEALQVGELLPGLDRYFYNQYQEYFSPLVHLAWDVFLMLLPVLC